MIVSYEEVKIKTGVRMGESTSESRGKIIFHPKQIEFKHYPFKIASVAKNPLLNAADIKEIRLNRRPLEVVTDSNEILFIGVYYEKKLHLFARVNKLPIVAREDVWSLLNEPFLDTSIGEMQAQQTMQRLYESGFTEREIVALRTEVSTCMTDYNAMLWEDFELSHCDVLLAYSYEKYSKAIGEEEKNLYDKFNTINNRGRIITPSTISTKDQVCYSIDQLTMDIKDFIWRTYGTMHSVENEKLYNEMNDWIISCYHQPHRHYHTLVHVLNVVKYCEELSTSVYFSEKKDNSILLRLAAWFHDIVYDPKLNDNEKFSADFMSSKMKNLIKSEDLVTIRHLIMITKSHGNAHSDDEKILSDADLSILAEEESIYVKYTKDIRREYCHIDDVTFRVGRLKFLDAILKRVQSSGHIYHFLDPLYESQALKNITIERELLV